MHHRQATGHYITIRQWLGATMLFCVMSREVTKYSNMYRCCVHRYCYVGVCVCVYVGVYVCMYVCNIAIYGDPDHSKETCTCTSASV